MANNGGPLFPTEFLDGTIGPGANLRDYFAGQAITALISLGDIPTKSAVSMAWDFAEAMIAERTKRYG